MWRRACLALAGLLLATCFAAVYDAVLLVTAWQRLGRAAAGLCATVASGDVPDEDGLARDFAYAAGLAHPDDVTRRGGMIVSVIGRAGPDSIVRWRRQIGQPGDSRYPAAGGPARVSLTGPSTLIAAELVAPISPWVVGGGLLHRRLHAHAEAHAAAH